MAAMERNAPRPFDAAQLEPAAASVDAAEVDRIVAEARREAARRLAERADLQHVVACMDLTSLNATDTPGDIERLVHRARAAHCAAVCVYPLRIGDAVRTARPAVKVATVAGAFPSGMYHLRSRVLEVQLCVEDGADEVDIVINRSAALQAQWHVVYEEVRAMREACGERAHLKAILATGELADYGAIYRASVCAMLAGADFIKTSTGKEPVNATPHAAVVMCAAIDAFHRATGIEVGFKPAGGIKTAEDALCYQAIADAVCGERWSRTGRGNELFRIGASSLLGHLLEALSCLR